MLRFGIAYVEKCPPGLERAGRFAFGGGFRSGGHMSRRRQPKTAQETILAVIAWARRAGFYNIAGELQDALLLLPGKDERRS